MKLKRNALKLNGRVEKLSWHPVASWVVYSLFLQRGADRHSVQHQQKAEGLRVAQLLLGQGEQETLHHRWLRQDERRLSHRSQRDPAQDEGAQGLARSVFLHGWRFSHKFNARLLISFLLTAALRKTAAALHAGGHLRWNRRPLREALGARQERYDEYYVQLVLSWEQFSQPFSFRKIRQNTFNI